MLLDLCSGLWLSIRRRWEESSSSLYSKSEPRIVSRASCAAEMKLSKSWCLSCTILESGGLAMLDSSRGIFSKEPVSCAFGLMKYPARRECSH